MCNDLSLFAFRFPLFRLNELCANVKLTISWRCFRLRLNPISRIDNSSAQSFLELVPEQVKSIKDVLSTSKRQAKKILGETATDEEKVGEIRSSPETIRTQNYKSLLLPHQSKRLDVLDEYMILLREGFAVFDCKTAQLLRG